jgi:serine/threonine protein kinase
MNGNYRIIKSLGTSRNGSVDLIEMGGTQYVLKSFNNENIPGLHAEIKIGERLNHPGFSGVIDHWYDNYSNTTKVLFNYTENQGDLSKFINNNTNLSVIEKVEIAYQIAKSLNFMHKNSMLHRDIKNQNIIMDLNNLPIIIDYDLSCVYAQGYTHIPKLYEEDVTCKDGEIAGTFNFMSVEYMKSSRIGYYIDVYSVGLVFLCLFGGFDQPPYPFPQQGEKLMDFFINQKIGTRDFFIETQEKVIYQNGKRINVIDKKLFDYPYICKLINRMILHPYDITFGGIEMALGMFIDGYTSR